MNFHAKALLDVLHNFEKIDNVSLKNFNKLVLSEEQNIKVKAILIIQIYNMIMIYVVRKLISVN